MDAVKKASLLADLEEIEQCIASFLKEIRSTDWTSTRTRMMDIDIHAEVSYRGIRDSIKILREGGTYGTTGSGTDAG